MYLRKLYVVQINYLLTSLLVLAFSLGAATCFADPPGITGRVVKYSSPSVGISGINLVVLKCGLNDDCSHITPTQYSAVTNAQGNYTLNIPPEVITTGGERSKKFYICASDPTNNYITECYRDFYFFYGSEEMSGGTAVTVYEGSYTKDIHFQLCESGNIKANMMTNIDRQLGYKVTLEGTVDFKNTHGIPFERELDYIDPDHLPAEINFKETPIVGALPYGTYSLKLEDMRLFHYQSEVFNFSSLGLSSDYYPYEIDDVPYYATRYIQNITLSSPSNLSKTVSFPAQTKLGVIYGIVTDNSGYEQRSRMVNMQVSSNFGKSVVDYREDPNSDSNEIGLILDPNHVAIHNIEMEIIPVNISQPDLVATTIPTKILIDPNSNFWIGRYGGYAFKFLKSGGYKIRVFRHMGSTDVFSAYYNGTNPLVYSLSSAKIINIGSTGAGVRADVKLPKVSISGKVTIAGGGSVAGAIVSLLNSAHEQICITMADPNKGGSFSFSELVSGNLIVRIAKTGGSTSYNVKKINLNGVELGQTRNLGTIQLQPFQYCSGSGSISGRVYWDEDPSVGLANVKVRAADIEHIYEDNSCTECLTDSDGSFTITGLPDSAFMPKSAFIVYTDQNTALSEFFDEMYENITIFPHRDTCNQNEVDLLSAMIKKIDKDPTQVVGDPSIIAKLVLLGHGESKEGINFGLSKYRYDLFSGMNLFAYSGTPLQYYSQAKSTFLSLLVDYSPHKFMSLISSAESGNGISWNVVHKTSTSGSTPVIEGDFPIEAGRSYLFYFNLKDNELYDVQFPFLFPPFTIPAVMTIELAGGLNLAAIPDGLDKGWQARHVLSDIQRVGGDARCISRYEGKTGKWKSMARVWGRPAGEDFRIKRDEGYLVHMKNTAHWSRD